MPRKFNLDTLVDGLLDFAADFIHGYAAQVQAQAQVAQPRVPRAAKHAPQAKATRTPKRKTTNARPYDLYDDLEVSPKASPETIRAAYLSLSKRYHPDVAKEKYAEARMKQINAAWEVLGDADKRKAYDKTLGGAR